MGKDIYPDENLTEKPAEQPATATPAPSPLPESAPAQEAATTETKPA